MNRKTAHFPRLWVVCSSVFMESQCHLSVEAVHKHILPLAFSHIIKGCDQLYRGGNAEVPADLCRQSPSLISFHDKFKQVSLYVFLCSQTVTSIFIKIFSCHKSWKCNYEVYLKKKTSSKFNQLSIKWSNLVMYIQLESEMGTTE